jgi:hypothetical protein
LHLSYIPYYFVLLTIRIAGVTFLLYIPVAAAGFKFESGGSHRFFLLKNESFSKEARGTHRSKDNNAFQQVLKVLIENRLEGMATVMEVLLNVCDAVLSDYVNDYQKSTGRLLPTRGNIQDLSGHITHKREIVSLYLQGYDTPRIAKKTRHARESVDRYIRDFETVRLLTQISTDPVRIGQLARLNPRVVQQYLDLLLEDPRTDNPRKEVDMTFPSVPSPT